MPPHVVCIIPARMGSSRFPGKPLAPILGLPMIEHVYRRCRMSTAVEAVHVATCDVEIQRAVQAFGGSAIMTLSSHERASDRVAEAARHLTADIVVMVQGDEPMVHPDMLDESVRPMLADETIACVNLQARIAETADVLDRNTIKVVADVHGNALYMSRSPIPNLKDIDTRKAGYYKQVCVIPFRRDALEAFARLPTTPLEQAESIDMLRFLENGMKVKMVETRHPSHAVDTPGDLAHVEQLMRHDVLAARYLGGAGARP